MKNEKRNIVLFVILSIATCGLFSIYWIAVLARDAVKVKDQNDSGILEVILTISMQSVGLSC